MSSISNSLTGNSLLAYVQNLSTKAQAGTADDTTSTSTSKTASTATTQLSAAAKAAVIAAAHSHQSTLLQSTLDKQQVALGTDLRAAFAKAGVQLSGSVSFSISSAGKLSVSGSDDDEAKVNKFLAADTSSPSFSSRITKLTTAAESLASTIKQSASISQAAKYGRSPAAMLSLYETLSSQQDATPATFSMTSAGSSLAYAGVLTSKA